MPPLLVSIDVVMPTKIPGSFHVLCQAQHQDVGLIVGNNRDDLIRYCLSFVQDDDYGELKGFIAKMLESKSSAELKGLMNREATNFYFRGRGASDFLKSVYTML